MRCQSKRRVPRGLVLGPLLAGLLGLGACSDLRDNSSLPSQPEVSVHPEGWINPAAKANFHGQAIRQSGWDMEGCKSCHGQDYAGGLVASSCLTCHSNTPQGCNVCHGSTENIAPPQDIQGNSETGFAGVGAHQVHLSKSASTRALSCTECHRFPQAFADPAHIDGDGRSEIIWGQLASAGENTPQFDPENMSCSDTYCHNGGKYGNGVVVVWNEVGSGQGACGTCHGLPPAEATGHPRVEEGLACSVCHGSVVDEDLNIIDKALHLNGKTDF